VYTYSKDMDNLQDLLAARTPKEPPEIRIIKEFVQQKFDEPVNVLVTEREIVVTVGSGSLASALRAYTSVLLAKCQSPDKRLALRIGRVTG
jgi:hypothetical protein